MISFERLLAVHVLHVLFAFFMLIIHWVVRCLQWTSYWGSGRPFCFNTPIPTHSVPYIFTTIQHLTTFVRKNSADIARCVCLVCASPLLQFQDIVNKKNLNGTNHFLYYFQILFKRSINLSSLYPYSMLTPNSGNESDVTVLL